jgi:hypothetical protein
LLNAFGEARRATCLRSGNSPVVWSAWFVAEESPGSTSRQIESKNLEVALKRCLRWPRVSNRNAPASQPRRAPANPHSPEPFVGQHGRQDLALQARHDMSRSRRLRACGARPAARDTNNDGATAADESGRVRIEDTRRVVNNMCTVAMSISRTSHRSSARTRTQSMAPQHRPRTAVISIVASIAAGVFAHRARTRTAMCRRYRFRYDRPWRDAAVAIELLWERAALPAATALVMPRALPMGLRRTALRRLRLRRARVRARQHIVCAGAHRRSALAASRRDDARGYRVNCSRWKRDVRAASDSSRLRGRAILRSSATRSSAPVDGFETRAARLRSQAPAGWAVLATLGSVRWPLAVRGLVDLVERGGFLCAGRRPDRVMGRSSKVQRLAVKAVPVFLA